jgi:uncharacterized membrane protein
MTGEVYEFQLNTRGVTPDLPEWLEKRAKTTLLKHGWELGYIIKWGQGYNLQVIKRGSVTIAVITTIVVLLLLINVGIVSYTIIKVGEQKAEAQDVATNAVASCLSARVNGDITQSEYEQCIGVIGETLPSNSGGLFGESLTPLLIIGGLAVIVGLIK